MAKRGKKGMDPSRRALLRGAIAGGVTLTSVGGISGVAAKAIREGRSVAGARLVGSFLVPPGDDDLRQEMVMRQKEYVLMTDEEKKELIDLLVRNYKAKGSILL